MRDRQMWVTDTDSPKDTVEAHNGPRRAWQDLGSGSRVTRGGCGRPARAGAALRRPGEDGDLGELRDDVQRTANETSVEPGGACGGDGPSDHRARVGGRGASGGRAG